MRVHHLTQCSTDTLNSPFKQRKPSIDFNGAARQVAIPVSNVSLKIASCTVSNVFKAPVSIATSKCITAFHAKRKPRSAQRSNSIKTYTPPSTCESEPKSVRVAPLLPRRLAVVIMLHVSMQLPSLRKNDVAILMLVGR